MIIQLIKNIELSLKIYDEEGRHIRESDQYLSIVQHKLIDRDSKTVLSFLVSKKPDDFGASLSSSWQLEKCRSCNKIPVQTCSDCNDSVERLKRCEGISIALMCMIKPEDQATRVVSFGYKIK